MSENRCRDCRSRAMWSGGGEFRREAAEVACSRMSPRAALDHVVEIGALNHRCVHHDALYELLLDSFPKPGQRPSGRAKERRVRRTKAYGKEQRGKNHAAEHASAHPRAYLLTLSQAHRSGFVLGMPTESDMPYSTLAASRNRRRPSETLPQPPRESAESTGWSASRGLPRLFHGISLSIYHILSAVVHLSQELVRRFF
jgi:hypothetical protein